MNHTLRHTRYLTLSIRATDEAALEADIMTSFRVNVVGNVHLFNFFLPLIKNGNVKKVVGISTGMADIDSVIGFEIDWATPYSISKAALDMVTAKYHVAYKDSGITFMNVSPGLVDTGLFDNSKSRPAPPSFSCCSGIRTIFDYN